MTLPQKKNKFSLIRLAKRLVTNHLLKREFTYEKGNNTWFCDFSPRLRAGFMRQFARNNHQYNAPDDCDDSSTTTHLDNNNDDTHERHWLLIYANRGFEASARWRCTYPHSHADWLAASCSAAATAPACLHDRQCSCVS
jgi:hypothetical protein